MPLLVGRPVCSDKSSHSAIDYPQPLQMPARKAHRSPPTTFGPLGHRRVALGRPWPSMGASRCAFEAGVEANGERYIWLPRAVVDRLRSLRGPGESYSHVIIRIARD